MKKAYIVCVLCGLLASTAIYSKPMKIALVEEMGTLCDICSSSEGVAELTNKGIALSFMNPEGKQWSFFDNGSLLESGPIDQRIVGFSVNIPLSDIENVYEGVKNWELREVDPLSRMFQSMKTVGTILFITIKPSAMAKYKELFSYVKKRPRGLPFAEQGMRGKSADQYNDPMFFAQREIQVFFVHDKDVPVVKKWVEQSGKKAKAELLPWFRHGIPLKRVD